MKVVFAHNVYDRLRTLKDTVVIEKNVFPDAQVSVECNDTFINIFQDITNFSVVSFNEKPHKIGCVNGCVLSIKKLLETDFDVLIFSNDDVHINEKYMHVVTSHINEVINGKYDVICRTPKEYGDNYYMMEVFYMSKKAVVEIFSDAFPVKDEIEIPTDLRGSISPEVWLFNTLNSKKLKIKSMQYTVHGDYNNQLAEQMGYYHVNIGQRGWKD